MRVLCLPLTPPPPRSYLALDPDAALRAAILSPSGDWAKTSLPSLLSKAPRREALGAEGQRAARAEAFDLLDALSRSGALPMAHAALHVVMGAVHSFDDTLIETVVQRSVNPIEKVERSLLIMASTLHQAAPAELVNREQLPRLAEFCPTLFPGGAQPALPGAAGAPPALLPAAGGLAPQLLLAWHAHLLTLDATHRAARFCNLCNRREADGADVAPFHRCDRCDWDACAACVARARSGVAPAPRDRAGV